MRKQRPSLTNSDSSKGSDTAWTAVDACLKLQSLPKDGINFRVLTALLEHAPTADGVSVIADHIVTASEEPDGLDQLANFYITELLVPSTLPFAHNICSPRSQTTFLIYSERWWTYTARFVPSLERHTNQARS